MQIHELTKRRKQRTDEAGLLKGITNAISAAKTGYDAVKGTSGSTLAGVGKALGTLGQAATSPGFAAQSSKEASSAAGVAKYNALAKKYGFDPMQDPNADNSAQTTPAAATAATGQADVAAVAKQITSTPEFADLSQVLPDPGKLLFVTMKNGGKYYKDENGVWKNESGTAIQGAPGTPGYGKAFDKILDADQYTQVDLKEVPFGATSGTAAASTKTNPARAAASATPPVKEARNPMAQRSAASVVKGIIAKNKTLAKKLSDPTVQQAVQAASAKLDTIAQTRGMAAKSKKKRMVSAAQAMAKAVVGAGQTAAPGTPAGQDQQAQSQPGVAAQGGQASPVQKNIAAQTITSKAKVDGTQLAKAVATDPQVKQAVATIAKESRKPLTKRLEEALQLLKEEQVYITKDIRIRTAKGDYVKRVSDQTWYDPNGVPIDPVKYADYVAKLDKTPQAQTQYQADAQKAAKGHGPGGTDTGAQQSAAAAAAAPPPPPPPPPQAPAAAAAPQPDPMDQALKQQKMAQWLRGQNVDSLNAQIKDTTNQLRNAQIFGTGQADYLQQQLAQLIAMKV
jgi:hypothetical protein